MARSHVLLHIDLFELVGVDSRNATASRHAAVTVVQKLLAWATSSCVRGEQLAAGVQRC